MSDPQMNRLNLDEDQLRTKLNQYDFYHIIKLTEEIQTAGVARYMPYQEVVLRALRSLDLENKSVLDVGCRDGLFSFEAEKLGAKKIIGIDNNLSSGAVELLIPYFSSKARMHEMNLLDLTPNSFGTFDIIIFAGVLYHLRYPFWSLKLIRDVLKADGLLILETAIFRDRNRYAMFHCPIGSESPYEPSSCSFFNRRGLTSTLSSLGFKIESTEVLRDRFQNKKLNAREVARFLLKRRKIADRITVICRKAPSSASASLQSSWNKTHKFKGWK